MKLHFLVFFFFVTVISFSVYAQYSSQTCILLLSMRNVINCASKFYLLIIMAMFLIICALKKLPTRSSVIIHCEWIWGPSTRNLTEITLRGFLYQGSMVQKNQPEVSVKVVSISWVLTVSHYCSKYLPAQETALPKASL